MERIKLELLEKNDEIKRLIDLLPQLEEMVEKYNAGKEMMMARSPRKSSESNFIRSFRKGEDKDKEKESK